MGDVVIQELNAFEKLKLENPEFYAQLMRPAGNRPPQGISDQSIILLSVFISGVVFIANEYAWNEENKKIQSYQTGGEFDKNLTFQERVKFLEENLMPVAKDVDFKVLARSVVLWPYGKFIKLVEESKKIAAAKKALVVSMQDIHTARRYIDSGKLDKENLLKRFNNNLGQFLGSDTSLKSIAIHEAAHAVVPLYKNCSRIIYEVSIDRRKRHAGEVVASYLSEQPYITQDFHKNNIMMSLAGGVAEQFFGLSSGYDSTIFTDVDVLSEYFSQYNFQTDSKTVYEGLYYLVKDFYPEVSKEGRRLKSVELFMELYQQTYQFVSEHKQEIEKVADYLLQHRTVSGDEIYDLLGVQKPLYDFEKGTLSREVIKD